jgi:RsiW-degrading membrane proteinase PrsW (M82 family)
MSNPPASRAAGFFIALSVLVGAIVGVAAGQPSLGTVIGFGVGVLVSLLLWLWDRRAG